MISATIDEGRGSLRLAGARLSVGFLQGILLFALDHAVKAKAWPATDAPVLAALQMACAFAPFVVLGGLGHARSTTLAIWTVVVALVTAFIGWHAARTDLYMAPGSPMYVSLAGFFAAVAVFCAHHLITPADRERRLVASYPGYFEAAWTDGIRLALASVFTGVFWILMSLGASLFDLIGLKGFGEFIRNDWFAYPVTGLFFAGAVQLSEVRVGLTKGLRTVVLVLLSWLLPVMGAIAVAFLFALPFTGLAVLWRAGPATGVLLGAIGALVVLINAVYQYGGQPAPAVLRWAARVTALALVLLTALAFYGLALRVGQHGLTPSRIGAAACVVVSIFYAVGYAWAAVRPGRWMIRLEATNIVTAVVIVGLIVALFTPIADPARLSVADQVGRLEAGRVKPATFDFDFLRFNSGRYGLRALQALAARTSGRDAGGIAALASAALKRSDEDRYMIHQAALPADFASKVAVYPRGAILPADFPGPNAGEETGLCLYRQFQCDAYLVDLDGDRSPEIILTRGFVLLVFAREAGAWRQVGSIGGPLCPGVADALRAGRYQRVPPESRWSDLMAAGQRLSVTPLRPDCPAAAPQPVAGAAKPPAAASPPRRGP